MIRRVVLVLVMAACSPPTAEQPVATPTAVTAAPATSPASTLPPPPRPAGHTVTERDHVVLVSEPGLGADIITRVSDRAEGSALSLETDFGKTFDYRPTVYVLATDESVKQTLVSLFGYGNPAAERTATSAAALAIPPQIVVVNWSRVSASNTLSAVHHELVHLIVAQRLKRGAYIPAWLNEGMAHLSETTLPGMEWLASTIRYGSASLAANKDLFPWNRIERHTFAYITQGSRDYAYVQSAQMVSFLRDDVGRDGLVRIFALVEEGAGFEAAYQQVAGKGIGEFAAALPDRMLALAPAFPGIVVAGDAPTGPGPSLLVYGLRPRTPVSIELRAGGARATSSGTTDDGGLYFVLLDTVSTGTYTATVTGSATTTATIRVVR
jgi:hypothetical protein